MPHSTGAASRPVEKDVGRDGPDAETPGPLAFRLLGPVSATRAGAAVPLAGTKVHTVLAVLLLARGAPVADRRLSAALWGDAPPPTAPAQLYTHVSRLRKALGNGARIHRKGTGYVFDGRGAEVDLLAFERLERLGGQALGENRHDEASGLLGAALGRWSGQALENTTEHLLRYERPRLEALRKRTLERRIEADLSLGRHRSLVPELLSLVARFPTDETLRAQLITALDRSDRQAEAVRVYGEGRRILDEQLGVLPGRRLSGAYLRMLRGGSAGPPDSRVPDRRPRPAATNTRMVTAVSEPDPTTRGSAAEALRSAIEEAAGLLEVDYARDDVRRVLDVYGGDLTRAVVAFRVSTGAHRTGELDCRFTVPRDVDPYRLALEHGLLEETGHPVGRLLAELSAHCPVDGYGIDFGVVGGFKKIWAVLPRTALQDVRGLAGLPSMPRALGESLGFVARHGLGDTVGLLGIDYRHRTVNVYFGEPPAGGIAPESVRAMLREVDQAEPSEQMLRLGRRAFGVYVTLTWDSPVIERICFAVATTDPFSLPVELDERIGRFVRHVRRADPDTRFVYAVASQPDGEYYKLQSYYRWDSGVRDIMRLPEGALADPV
ncbi:aromatic prenyltransferase [Streptomyces huiliensis]|uniref:aromatic prenyltransferase n=1 Tax=Streptomyces huiliensis TaxID=2876027 RepID=UPI001CBE8010|nr:aromatic prenyltransferase [Streptomyces huiliensis]MBZ4320828.1 winged helix-turn-helix domain-containing protein [Streptomyces huiliensis]